MQGRRLLNSWVHSGMQSRCNAAGALISAGLHPFNMSSSLCIEFCLLLGKVVALQLQGGQQAREATERRVDSRQKHSRGGPPLPAKRAKAQTRADATLHF